MSIKFSKINKIKLNALSAGERLTEHGIAVERTNTGDLRWSVNIMVDAQRIHRVVGLQSAGVTREQALRTIEVLRTKAREARLQLPAGRKTHRTFREAACDYKLRMIEGGGKDIANKTRHLDQQLIPFFGDKPITSITSYDIERYTKHRAGKVQPATINREIATLSHTFNRFVDWRWITTDQKPRFMKFDEQRKPISILSEDEAAQLMDAASQDGDDRVQLFVAFGLNAAMRHSEIVSVRYDQIDFEDRRLIIPKAKAGMREQPITSALATMLKADRRRSNDPDGWVFPALNSAKTDAARRSHRPSMEYGFKRTVIRAGFDPAKVTPHVMRHTAITRLIKAGVDLPTVQRISGHKTLAMVMRYAHIHGRHIDDAITTLNLGRPVTRELHRPVQAFAPEG